MAKVIVGVFKNTEHAGMAVSELKQAGFTKEVSVVAKDVNDLEAKTEKVKDETGATGATVGAALGALAGIIASTATIAAPGIGILFVAGPFTALMTAASALTGGLAGFFVQRGINEQTAKEYEAAVKRGEVLVVVEGKPDSEEKIRTIFDKHGAYDISTQSGRFAGM